MSTDSIQRPAAARQGSEGAHMQRSATLDGPAQHGPTPEDVQPVAFENLDRFLTGLITVGPMVALGVVGWQLWDGLLHGSDLVVFAVMYLLTGLGVTVGLHRLFTHRSFKTSPAVRFVFAVLGSAAIEGPVISWVADHRKHHAFSDREGDPHSPHVGHGGGWRGALRGLGHAHVGWLFIHTQRGSRERYAPDLLADPVTAFVDRTFLVWALRGLAAASRWGSRSAARCARGHRAAVGRGGADARPAPRDLQHQLLCHFFSRTSCHRRPVAQPRLAGLPSFGRPGTATACLPDLGEPRPGPAPARHLGAADRRPGVSVCAGTSSGSRGACERKRVRLPDRQAATSPASLEALQYRSHRVGSHWTFDGHGGRIGASLQPVAVIIATTRADQASFGGQHAATAVSGRGRRRKLTGASSRWTSIDPARR